MQNQEAEQNRAAADTAARQPSQDNVALAGDASHRSEPEEGTLEIKASIHMNDEIVLGTASVNQSVHSDNPPLVARDSNGGMVQQVQHYLQNEELPERAQSQLEHQASHGALSMEGDAKGDGVQTRNDIRSSAAYDPMMDDATVIRQDSGTATVDPLNNQKQVSETVHTAFVNSHTVPHTAVNKRETNDDYWRGEEEEEESKDGGSSRVLPGEAGAVAQTELGKNISHGFPSDHMLVQHSHQLLLDKCKVEQNPTETEKTGSQVVFNPGATGELEFDKQQVEGFLSNQEISRSVDEIVDHVGESHQEQPESPTLEQEAQAPSDDSQQQVDGGQDDLEQEEAEQQSQQNYTTEHEAVDKDPSQDGKQDVQQLDDGEDGEDDDDDDEVYSDDQDQVDGDAVGGDKHTAIEETPDRNVFAIAEPNASDDSQKQPCQEDSISKEEEKVEELQPSDSVGFPDVVEKETVSQDDNKESDGDSHGSNIEIKSSKQTTAKAEQRVQVKPTVRDTAVMDELERLVINLNHAAMANLKTDQFSTAKQLLFKAELNLAQVDSQCAEFQVATDSISDLGDNNFAKKAGIGPLDSLKNRLMGLTYNNLGCLCKQQQDFKGALEYLKKALNFESRLEELEEEERNLEQHQQMDADVKDDDLEFERDLQMIQCNSAGTILNICAILSKLNRHKQAQEYAFQAIEKLRHSMRLTKSKVMQAQKRISATQSQLDQAQQQLQQQQDDQKAIDTEDEVKELLGQLEKQEAGREELENQWVNLATTAVIAHYNAAVELEFTSYWRQALEQYEKAMQLAALAMKDRNPMSAKIKQAIGKMRMKVRNKVQLPDKLALQANKGKKGAPAAPGRSFASGSKMGASSNTPALKDWQTSANSTRSSQFNQQFHSLKVGGNNPLLPAMTSNEYTTKDFDQSSPRRGVNFHPNASLDTTDNNLTQNHQLSQFENPNARQSLEGSTQIMAKKVGLKTAVNKARYNNERSPLSLKKIINKLEQTEKQEAAKQLQPKSKFRPQRANPLPSSYRANSISQQPGGEENQTMSVLRERQNGLAPGTALNSIRTVSMPGSRISRNCAQRNTVNSAGFNDANDPNFLPSLTGAPGQKQMNASTGFNKATRNHGRGSTMQGVRETQTPLNQNSDRIVSTSFPKTMRSVQQKPLPGMNTTAWAWGTLPATIDESSTTPININVRETSISSGVPQPVAKHHRRAGTIDASQMGSTLGGADVSISSNMSPTRLQAHLSAAQERHLIEQGKRLGANKTKREQDINFFLGHIKKQSLAASKGSKGKTLRMPATSPAIKMTDRIQMPTDLASMRAQVIMEATATQLAGSAYLPSKLKKTLKQRQYVSQIKTMQKQLVKEKQIDLNTKLETAFQREMAMWKSEREQQLDNKLKQLNEEQERKREELEAEAALRLTQQTTTNFEDDERLMLLNDTAMGANTQLLYQGMPDEPQMKNSQDLSHTRAMFNSIPPGMVAKLPSEAAGDEDGQLGDALSAEQAQEARSIQQDSTGNANQLGADAGASIEQDEEEVGNFRVSPHPPHLKSKFKGVKTNDYGKMSIMDEAPAGSKNNAAAAPKDSQEEQKTLGTGTGQSSQIPVSEYVSSHQNGTNEHINNNNNQPVDALSGTQCQEVELEHSPDKQSDEENLEVEDVVSASTNNAAHNFQSYRTSSNVFRTTGVDGVVELDGPKQNRVKADSALRHASTKGARQDNRQKLQNSKTAGNRSLIAKSQLEVVDLNQIGEPNAILGSQQDRLAAATPVDYHQYVNEATSQEQHPDYVEDGGAAMHMATAQEKALASHFGASSIEGSQMTETVMTLKSEYADGMNIRDSTLHEETIAGWKVHRTTTRPASRLMAGTPELTDGQETVLEGKNSQIGDGPIFIKKSTDFHTSNRRIKHIDSIRSLGGTKNPRRGIDTYMVSKDATGNTMDGLSRPGSRNVSDITCTTQQIKYNESRILQAKKISLGDSSVLAAAILDSSLAQKSEMAYVKHKSNMSIDESSSVPDNTSQITEVVHAQNQKSGLRIKTKQKQTPAMSIVKSGQATVQAQQKSNYTGAAIVSSFENSRADVTPAAESFMTPLPGLNQNIIQQKDTFDRNTFDRTSQDTEKASKQAPKHIQYSKSTNKHLPPPHRQGATKKQNTMQKNGHLLYIAQMANQPAQSKPATSSQIRQQKAAQPPIIDQTPIPAMIHVMHQQNVVAAAARTTVTSPQVGAKRSAHTVVPTPEMQIMAKSGDHRQTVLAQQNQDDRAYTPMDSAGQQKTENVVVYTDMAGVNEEDGNQNDEGVDVHTDNTVDAYDAHGTEDRVAKIAQKISKLNTTLLQFQKENEETRKDPTLKSTHRSTASKQGVGLMSQKSRDNYVTMPAMAQAVTVQQPAAELTEENQTTQQEQRAVEENTQSASDRSPRLTNNIQQTPAIGEREMDSVLSASAASRHDPKTATGVGQPHMINVGANQDEASLGDEIVTPRNANSNSSPAAAQDYYYQQ